MHSAALSRAQPTSFKHPGAAWTSAVAFSRLHVFAHLGLSDKVIAAVAAAGYTTPTPDPRTGHPARARPSRRARIAQTGTGRTAAFVLPMLTMLAEGRACARMPRTLILELTRRLAAQVEESFNKYGAKRKLTVALIMAASRSTTRSPSSPRRRRADH
jgi:superfamily II DNA/RNA helicase